MKLILPEVWLALPRRFETSYRSLIAAGAVSAGPVEIYGNVVRMGIDSTCKSAKQDVAFGEALWKAMEQNHMVGPNRFQSMPYQTPPPHGHMVEVLEGNISVDGRNAPVIVKKNFCKTKKGRLFFLYSASGCPKQVT